MIEKGAPVLFHCSGGKDRTGMTAALLLLTLGVDRDIVIGDFAKTEYYLADYIEETVAEIERENPGSGERVRPLLEAKPEYIEAFLEAVEDGFGTVDNFLRYVINVDVDLLREQYLD